MIAVKIAVEPRSLGMRVSMSAVKIAMKEMNLESLR